MALIVVFSYLALIGLLFILRFPIISPPVALVVFFSTNYGLHTHFPEFMNLSKDLPDAVHLKYSIITVFGIAGIALGLSLGSAMTSKIGNSIDKMPELKPLSTAQNKIGVLILTLLVSVVFLSLDLPSFSRTIEHLNYIFSTSELTYTQIRREMFGEHPLSIAQDYVRNGIVPMLISLLVIRICYPPNNIISKVFLIGLTVLLFIATILSLSKFPTIYVILCVLGALILYRFGEIRSVNRVFIYGVLIIVLGFVALDQLYQLQYRDAISSGTLDIDHVRNLLFYRPFLGQADVLRFWLVEWPESAPHVGFRSIGPIARAFSLDLYIPSIELPRKYIGNQLTTWQTGFMGSGYASWGVIGAFFYAVIAGFASVISYKIVRSLRHRDICAAAMMTCSMTMYFLNSREIGIAMLSGNVFLAPLFAVFLDRLFRARRK